mmetsp:Transcript_26737/g.61094  ORF Transcript_26737/g.61094 Transcript_26737/m.61094 type:complete len:282 (-) Transcript_26737:121-966(-)
MKLFAGLAYLAVCAAQDADTPVPEPEVEVAPAPPPPPPVEAAAPTAAASQYKDRATARHLSEMHPDEHGDVHLEFRKAIADEDDLKLESLVKFGVKVTDQYHEEDGNAMHEAAMHGKAKAIAALAKHGVSPDVLDRRGRTPMYWAAANSDMAVAEALLKVGAKIMGGQDSDGQSGLRRAIQNRDAPMTEFLLKNGADIHLKNRNGGCAIDAAHENWEVHGDDRFYQLIAKHHPKDSRVVEWISHHSAKDANLARRLGGVGSSGAGAAAETAAPAAASDPDL